MLNWVLLLRLLGDFFLLSRCVCNTSESTASHLQMSLLCQRLCLRHLCLHLSSSLDLFEPLGGDLKCRFEVKEASARLGWLLLQFLSWAVCGTSITINDLHLICCRMRADYDRSSIGHRGRALLRIAAIDWWLFSRCTCWVLYLRRCLA